MNVVETINTLVYNTKLPQKKVDTLRASTFFVIYSADAAAAAARAAAASSG